MAQVLKEIGWVSTAMNAIRDSQVKTKVYTKRNESAQRPTTEIVFSVLKLQCSAYVAVSW